MWFHFRTGERSAVSIGSIWLLVLLVLFLGALANIQYLWPLAVIGGVVLLWRLTVTTGAGGRTSGRRNPGGLADRFDARMNNRFDGGNFLP